MKEREKKREEKELHKNHKLLKKKNRKLKDYWCSPFSFLREISDFFLYSSFSFLREIPNFYLCSSFSLFLLFFFTSYNFYWNSCIGRWFWFLKFKGEKKSWVSFVFILYDSLITLFVVNANREKWLKNSFFKRYKINMFKVLSSNQDLILNKYKNEIYFVGCPRAEKKNEQDVLHQLIC